MSTHTLVAQAEGQSVVQLLFDNGILFMLDATLALIVGPKPAAEASNVELLVSPAAAHCAYTTVAQKSVRIAHSQDMSIADTEHYSSLCGTGTGAWQGRLYDEIVMSASS